MSNEEIVEIILRTSTEELFMIIEKTNLLDVRDLAEAIKLHLQLVIR